MARQAGARCRRWGGAAGTGGGTNPVGGGLAGQGTRPVGGGLAGPGPAGGGLTGSGATGAASAGPAWPPVTGPASPGHRRATSARIRHPALASQAPPVPHPPPRLATSAPPVPHPPARPGQLRCHRPHPPARPGHGRCQPASVPAGPEASHGTQPARRRPARAGTLPPGDQTSDGSRQRPVPLPGSRHDWARPSAVAARPGLAFPQEDGPADGPDPAKGGPPAAGAALPPQPGPAVAEGPRSRAGTRAGRSEAGSTRPKTGVPPWEITDSFMAVPPAEASGTQASGGRHGGGGGQPAGQPARQRARGAAARRTAPRVSPPWVPVRNSGPSPGQTRATAPRASRPCGRGPTWKTRSACSRRCGEPTTGRPRTARTDLRRRRVRNQAPAAPARPWVTAGRACRQAGAQRPRSAACVASSSLRTDAYIGTYSCPDRLPMALITSSVTALRACAPGGGPGTART